LTTDGFKGIDHGLFNGLTSNASTSASIASASASVTTPKHASIIFAKIVGINGKEKKKKKGRGQKSTGGYIILDFT